MWNSLISWKLSQTTDLSKLWAYPIASRGIFCKKKKLNLMSASTDTLRIHHSFIRHLFIIWYIGSIKPPINWSINWSTNWSTNQFILKWTKSVPNLKSSGFNPYLSHIALTPAFHIVSFSHGQEANMKLFSLYIKNFQFAGGPKMESWQHVKSLLFLVELGIFISFWNRHSEAGLQTDIWTSKVRDRGTENVGISWEMKFL